MQLLQSTKEDHTQMEKKGCLHLMQVSHKIADKKIFLTNVLKI